MVLFVRGEYYQKPVTTVTIDTVYVHRTITDTLVKPVFRIRTDTIKVQANVDSIFQVAKEYWATLNSDTSSGAIQYVAMKDSTYEDSLLTAHVAFVSRIPLDPESFFEWQFNIKQSEINKTIEYEKPRGFFDSFGLGFGLGYSYDLLNERLVPTVSFGIVYKL